MKGLKNFFITLLLFLSFLLFSISFAQLPEDAPNKLEQSVPYQLPYPGILPDHPLYFLKKLKENLALWFTFDQQAKTEKLLLYSDKRTAMSQSLIKKGKVKLALKTAVEAEKLFEKTIQEVKKNKIEDPEFISRIKLSHEKHVEVAEKLIRDSRLDPNIDLINDLNQALDKNRSLVKEI